MYFQTYFIVSLLAAIYTLPTTVALVKVVKLQALVFYTTLVESILGEYSPIFFAYLLGLIQFSVVADFLYLFQFLPPLALRGVVIAALSDGS